MAAVEDQQAPPRDASVVVQQATQLEFTQAMQDFKTMFPDVDEDVIEAVLRANQGAVDATIDQLLTMSTDNENERLRTEMDAADNAESPPSYSPTTPPPSYQQAVPGTSGTPPARSSPVPSAATDDPPPPVDAAACADLLADDLLILPLETPAAAAASAAPAVSAGTGRCGEAAAAAAAAAPASAKGGVMDKQANKWLPPLLGPLPADFLRINGASSKTNSTREMTAALCSEIIQQKLEENERQRRLGSSSDDPELVRYLEDERIALFLQNEEFMQELRRNKEFLSTLEGDSSDEDLDKAPDETMGPFPFTKSVPSEDSDAAFREKLKNMGKLSRRKFAQLARIFTRRKKRSAKQILSEGTMPSQDNLLLEDDDYAEDSGDDAIDSKDDKSPHTNVLCSDRLNGPGA